MKLLRAAYIRKRSKFDTMEGGHLHYVGGKVKKNPTLVIQSVDEQQRLIKTIHDTAHLGRDKCQRQNQKNLMKKTSATLLVHPIPVTGEVWLQIGMELNDQLGTII